VCLYGLLYGLGLSGLLYNLRLRLRLADVARMATGHQRPSLFGRYVLDAAHRPHALRARGQSRHLDSHPALP
jgi:hypothetical protein